MKYSSHPDPYTYKDQPNVLVNKFNIKDEKALETIEQIYTNRKLADINKYPKGKFDLAHMKALHKYLFEDVYEWAGELRSVGVAKGSTVFCSPQYIESSYGTLYKDIAKDKFLKAISPDSLFKRLAYYHGEMNIIHPFREGNGRTTRAFLDLMLFKSHELRLDFTKIDKEHFIEASIDSAAADYSKMENIYKVLLKDSLKHKKTLELDKDITR